MPWKEAERMNEDLGVIPVPVVLGSNADGSMHVPNERGEERRYGKR